MKKILLIGSNGYIGSFIRQNISKKYELTCVDTCWFDDPHSECIVKDYKIDIKGQDKAGFAGDPEGEASQLTPRLVSISLTLEEIK